MNIKVLILGILAWLTMAGASQAQECLIGTTSCSHPIGGAGGGGGGPVDTDNNGLYEWAFMHDADGDGSGGVTCTAKNAPDLACKVAGQVIYRDWMDDVNVMMRDEMDLGGVIQLPAGTLVSWPCYDASRRGESIIDPQAAADDALVLWNDPRIETDVQFTGTSTGGSDTTLVDSAAPFVQDDDSALDMTGWDVTVTVDAGVDLHLKVASNTDDTITFAAPTDQPCSTTDFPFSGCTGSAAGDATTSVDADDAYTIVVGSAWRDQIADTAYGDCPLDGTGGTYRLINLAPRDWSGTIIGMGADPLRNDTSSMGTGTARPTGPTGTFIAQDYGTDDSFGYAASAGDINGVGRSGWFGIPRKNRHIVLGVDFEKNITDGTAQYQAGAGVWDAYSNTVGAALTGGVAADTNSNGIADDYELIIAGVPTGAVQEYQFDDTSEAFDGAGFAVGDRIRYVMAAACTDDNDDAGVPQTTGSADGFCDENGEALVGSTGVGKVSWHTVAAYQTATRVRFSPNLPVKASTSDTYDIYSVQWYDKNYVCVCPTATACSQDAATVKGNDGGANFIDELNKGDILVVQAERAFLAPETFISGRILEDGTAFTTACGPVGSQIGERVYLGNISIDASETDQADRGSGGFYSPDPKQAMKVGVVPQRYMESNITITNLSIGPQDFMNEAGGDCSTTYVTPWQETEAGWSDGINCDTGHMAAYVGMGNFVFDKVIFKHGGSYVIDGISHVSGRNLVTRSSFLYHTGKGIFDGPWNMYDVEIREGHFFGDVASNWMGPQYMTNIRVVNNIFSAFTTLAGYAYDKQFTNFKFLGNTMNSGWYVNGGAFAITWKDIYVDGWRNIGVRYPLGNAKLSNAWTNSVIVFDGAAQPTLLSGNTVDGVTLIGSIGNVIGFGEASIGADLIVGNTIRNVKHFTDYLVNGPQIGTDGQQVSNNRSIGPLSNTDPGTEWCTIVFRGNGGNGDDGESQIAANNFFFDIWNNNRSVPLFGVGTQNTAGCEYALYANHGQVPLTVAGDCSTPSGAAECITGCGLAQEGDYFTIQRRCE
jgi:hypothetical protein